MAMTLTINDNFFLCGDDYGFSEQQCAVLNLNNPFIRLFVFLRKSKSGSTKMFVFSEGIVHNGAAREEEMLF